MTLVLLWNLPAIGERVERKPRVRSVSRLAYRGTNDPRKAQITPSQPTDTPFTGQHLSPRLAALFVFALDAMD